MLVESIVFLYVSNGPMNGILLLVVSIFLTSGRDAGYKIKSHGKIEKGATQFVNDLLKFTHTFSTMCLSGHMARSIFVNKNGLTSEEGSSMGFLIFWASAFGAYAMMWSYDAVYIGAAPIMTIASLAYVAYKSESCPAKSTWSQCLF